MADELGYFSKKRMNARLQNLDNIRSPHMSDWQKITQVIRPTRGQYIDSSPETSKRPTSMVNSTPAVASRTLSAGMLSGAASPAYQWFKLELDDTDMAKWGPAKIALEQREMIMNRWLSRSNFYQQLQSVFGDGADFGTGCGIINTHKRDLFSTQVFSPGQYWIDVDENGDVDTIYAKIQFTVIQIMSRWRDRASTRVKDSYNKGEYNTKYSVILVIERNQDLSPDEWDEPNVDAQNDLGDWRKKPWNKFVYQEDNKDEGQNNFLEISGYNEWPGFDLRWDVSSGNIWGDGPGLLALGDAAALQTTEFRNAQGIEKAVKPPLRAPIFLKNKPIGQSAGGITFYDPFGANNAQVEPIYTIQAGVLNALLQDIERHERRINEVYYKDLFLMLASTDRREITAREVEEKHQEKLLVLGPTLQRTHRDTLSNAIIRVYRILDKAGVFPPAPAELRGRQLSIRYTSVLAYAQRAAGASSIERFFGFLGNLAPAFPAVRNKVNTNRGVDYYADSIGVPAEIMVSDEEANAAGQAEAQAAQAPQQAAAGKDLAQAGQILSQTDTTRPSALQFLLNQGGY